MHHEFRYLMAHEETQYIVVGLPAIFCVTAMDNDGQFGGFSQQHMLLEQIGLERLLVYVIDVKIIQAGLADPNHAREFDESLQLLEVNVGDMLIGRMNPDYWPDRLMRVVRDEIKPRLAIGQSCSYHYHPNPLLRRTVHDLCPVINVGTQLRVAVGIDQAHATGEDPNS